MIKLKITSYKAFFIFLFLTSTKNTKAVVYIFLLSISKSWKKKKKLKLTIFSLTTQTYALHLLTPFIFSCWVTCNIWEVWLAINQNNTVTIDLFCLEHHALNSKSLLGSSLIWKILSCLIKRSWGNGYGNFWVRELVFGGMFW